MAIIGAGVSGASVAKRLSEYDISIALLEREADVSFGTSKANSGIIHGGFHHSRRYLKARLEIQGAEMYPQLHRDLGFPYRQCGIVVAAFSAEELATIGHLYRQGVENGAPGIELCSAERLRGLEPKLHSDVVGGLYAPAGGIIEPYRFVFSLVENALANGVTLIRDFDVAFAKRSFSKRSFHTEFILASVGGEKIAAKYVVNAAGLYADEVSQLLGGEKFSISPRRGEYHLLDRRTTACPTRVVFPVPTPLSKGMVVIPTVEGTVLLGPTADDIQNKNDVDTTAPRMNEIISSAKRLIPSISEMDVITSFAGLRPILDEGDFFIAESTQQPGVIQVAGIQSPGLTAAPAVGEYVKDLLKAAGCKLTERPGFVSTAAPVIRTRTSADAAVHEAWKHDCDAGQVVCRCETVTRAEIRNAIRAGHTTLDGVKFYSRALAGRCQGAFCTPRILDLIAEETGQDVTEITKRGTGSEIIAETLPGTRADRPAPELPQARAGRRGTATIDPDVVVIGAGAAGMAAAREIAKRGYRPVILDRELFPGGVLRQCIHNGFGIHEYGEELTGPEYAERTLSELRETGTEIIADTTVLGIHRESDGYVVRALSQDAGLRHYKARAIMLAMGSRERNRGGIQIPGARPAGILTAGAAQRLINVEGYVPGSKVVIIGSGDIGLIMARRMRLVGAEVEAVVEILPVPSGINRNIVQCLNDFSIPLYLGHVVTNIHGRSRVSGVTVAPLDNGVVRRDRSFEIECDTVMLSVGLIPENELSRDLGVTLHPQTRGPVVDSRLMTNKSGVFAAGNVLHIHDVVDYVSEEARRAGGHIANYLAGDEQPRELETISGSNVRYVTPGRIDRSGENTVYLRSLIARVGAVVEIRAGGAVLRAIKQHHVVPSEMISITIDGRVLPPDIDAVEVSLI